MVSRRILWFTVFLLVTGMPASVFAGPVGTLTGGGSYIEWQSTVTGHDRIVLTVAAPNGDVFTKEFASDSPVLFRLKDLRTPEDGIYNYQLTVIPRVSDAVRKELQAAREAGDEAAQHALKAAGIQEIQQSGAFTIVNGFLVSPNAPEKEKPGRISASTSPSGGRAHRPGTPVVNDQVIPDDLIVQGNACVGLDCVNGEAFGFDTVRIKEVNTRIQFNDTSSTSGTTTNNWQIRANASTSGGANFLAFVDQNASDTGEAGDIVFAVEAGAPTNSVWVDSTGRVGFRQTTPVLDLHIATGNTPAIRLEQTAGGFAAQAWDIAGNEANFFVRDITVVPSTMPFRIRPGAPTSSLDISADGDVGIGITAPTRRLDISKEGACDIGIRNTSGTDVRWFLQTDNDTNKTFKVSRDGGGGPVLTVDARNDLNGVTFRVDGSVQATNVVFSSSRELKNELGTIDGKETLARLATLPISKWTLKTDQKATAHIGPMAEDFHKLFNVGQDEKHLAVTDVNGVALAAIQGLAQLVRERDEEITALLRERDREVTMLKSRLADLEKQLAPRP